MYSSKDRTGPCCEWLKRIIDGISKKGGRVEKDKGDGDEVGGIK